MNATAALAPNPIAADPAFVSQVPSDNSVNNDPGSDFASVFSHAGGKSSHKTADARPNNADSSGGQSPIAGKDLPPPPTQPQPSQSHSQPPAATAGTAADGPGATARSAAKGSDGSSAAAPAGPAAAAAAGVGAASGPGIASTTNAANAANAATTGTGTGTSFDLQELAGGPRGDDAAITGAAAAAIPGAKADAASVRAASIGTVAGIATTAGATAAAESGPGAADAGHAAATTVQSAATGDAAANALSLAAAAPSPAAAALANDAANAADRGASTADDSQTPADGATVPDGAAPAGAAGDAATATAAAAAQTAAAAAATAAPIGAPAAGLAISTAGIAAGAVPIARALTELVGAGGADKHPRSDADEPGSADTSIAAAGTGQSGVTFDTSPAPILKVNAGVETPEFAQGLAERVSTMVDANLTSARLQVNPAQLGPIEVRIAVQGDHALVWLTSHSAVTRDALESSSSKLREMLGAQGFAQVSVDVSQRHFQERPAPSQSYDNAPTAESQASTASVIAPAASRGRLSTGSLDAYA